MFLQQKHYHVLVQANDFDTSVMIMIALTVSDITIAVNCRQVDPDFVLQIGDERLITNIGASR
jgi:hypothetical protein